MMVACWQTSHWLHCWHISLFQGKFCEKPKRVSDKTILQCEKPIKQRLLGKDHE